MRREGQLGPCLDWLEKLQQNKFKLGLKKKLFVSCNPTLTSFYSKKSLP